MEKENSLEEILKYVRRNDSVILKPEKIRILYVDDEAINLMAFQATFRRFYEVYTAISATEGKKIVQEKDIHIIITDQRMPHMTGTEFLASIVKEYPDPIRILLTGYTDIDTVVQAINKGHVYKYLIKPWNEQELKMTIENAYELYSLRRENKELIKTLLQTNKQLEFLLRQKLLM